MLTLSEPDSRMAEPQLRRTAIDICLCTYRRASVAEAIRALGRQEGCESIAMRLVVADNAPDDSARAAIAASARAAGLAIHYVHAPANNISVARNACLDAATAEWIAFLDDDEIPSPLWLAALLAEAAGGGWDVVLGPVIAIYPKGAPRWLAAGDFHSTRPVRVRGAIETGYAGNVLIRGAAIARASLRFAPELGRTGGEDVDFFYRLRDAGACIGYAQMAVAYEPVTDERANLLWLVARRFRAGQTHGARQRRRGRLAWPLALAAAKAAICAGGAALLLPFAVPRNRFLIRGALHAGVVARLMGVREIRLY